MIFVGFLVVLVIVFSYHTYKGSAINAHPHDASEQAPGAGDPSDPGGQSRTHEAHGDELGAGGGFSTHSTKKRVVTRRSVPAHLIYPIPTLQLPQRS